MESDTTSQTGSMANDIEFVSDLGSEMSEFSASENEPDPASPVRPVNDVNNGSDAIFSDASSDNEDIPYPDEQPPEWESAHFRDFHVPIFKGPPEGPNLPNDFDVAEAKAIDYFQLFFTDDLLTTIVQNTNSYALWSIRHKQVVNPQYKDPQWGMNGENNLSLPELKAFLGLQIIFGLNPVKQYSVAFSACSFLGNEGVRRTMSQKRFEKLCQYFHVSNRDNEPGRNSDEYDPLFKIRPVMEQMLNSFPRFSSFTEHQTVDEAMIRCKARLPFIIFNKSKPTRRGIQVFVRTDSKTGYCQQFEFYLGSKMTKPSERGLYFDVIDRLSKPLYGSNAKLFFDNAYSSVMTAIHLQRNGVQSTGTLRAVCHYNPPLFKAKKKLKFKRGEHKTFQAKGNPSLTATVWQDVKLVMFLSTMAKPHITTTSHRRVGRSNILVSTPHIAKLYHRFYKGTDFFAQLCERYDISRRHYHSWIYLFNFMFNAAVVNSYILFKSTSLHERKKKFGQFDFRHELALGLINNFSNRVRALRPAPVYVGPNAPLEVVNHQNQHMNSKRVRTCTGHKRFEGKTKKTAYGCRACNIHLCKQCHPKWHNP